MAGRPPTTPHATEWSTIVTFRLSKKMKADMVAMARIGDRSQGWIVRQALDGMFRDIEDGSLPIETILAARDRPDEIRWIWGGQVIVPAVTADRLHRLRGRMDVPDSIAIRLAVGRYMARRQDILRGRIEARDDLRERGPTFPP